MESSSFLAWERLCCCLESFHMALQLSHCSSQRRPSEVAALSLLPTCAPLCTSQVGFIQKVMYSCKVLIINLAAFRCKVLIIILINPLHAGFAFSFPFLDSKIMFANKMQAHFFFLFQRCISEVSCCASFPQRVKQTCPAQWATALLLAHCD